MHFANPSQPPGSPSLLWVVYWTMSHTAVQQPHWYKGIRRCYENRRGEKNPLPLKLMCLRKPHRQKAIIFSSDLRGGKKKSENMSFTADYNGQAVSVFRVWLPSIGRRLIGPGIVWLMQSHRRGGAVQSHKRSQVITYVKRNGFSLKTPAASGDSEVTDGEVRCYRPAAETKPLAHQCKGSRLEEGKIKTTVCEQLGGGTGWINGSCSAFSRVSVTWVLVSLHRRVFGVDLIIDGRKKKNPPVT